MKEEIKWSEKRSRSAIKKKIIKDNLLDYECHNDGCDVYGIWLGEEISLHLDYINGIKDDNRLSNLRFLCPNCHSQTNTYCGKNNKVRYTPKNKKVSDCEMISALRECKSFGSYACVREWSNCTCDIVTHYTCPPCAG